MAAKTKHILFAIAGVTCLVSSCREKVKQQPVTKKPEHSFSVNGSIREMKISPEVTEFPDHDGKAEFVSYCAMCHSLRYITAQPDFPRKTWEAELTKMVAKYKAPIDSITGKKIVDYLVTIKGIK